VPPTSEEAVHFRSCHLVHTLFCAYPVLNATVNLPPTRPEKYKSIGFVDEVDLFFLLNANFASRGCSTRGHRHKQYCSHLIVARNDVIPLLESPHISQKDELEKLPLKPRQQLSDVAPSMKDKSFTLHKKRDLS
jgi:hypothetical protein